MEWAGGQGEAGTETPKSGTQTETWRRPGSHRAAAMTAKDGQQWNKTVLTLLDLENH